MTATAVRLDETAGGARSRLPRLDLAEHGAVAFALVVWAFPVTHAVGGRGPGAVRNGLLALLPALVLTRPWSRLPSGWVAGLLGLSTCAFAVCLLAPTGFAGGQDAATYAYVSLAALTAAAYGRTAGRRQLLAGALVLAGLNQVARAAVPWLAVGEPRRILTGTYYWHNPFAASLLAPAVIGLAAIVTRARPLSLLGWVTVPMAVAGIVFSTSRATLACLLLGWLVVPVLLVPGPQWRVRGRRFVAVTALVVCVLFVLPGPPFFSERVTPFTSTATRAGADQSLEGHGRARLEFWHRAVEVVRHRPLVGGGYRTLSRASDPYVPSGYARSPLAHNGFLQPWADGGLLLGLPFLLVSVALVAALGRRLIRFVRARDGDRSLEVGALAATGLLLLHSAVDFDWTHAALFVMAALTAALALTPASPPANRRMAPFLALACVVALGLGAVVAHSWDSVKAAIPRSRAAAFRAGEDPATAEAVLRRAQSRPFADYRLAAELLRVALPEHLIGAAKLSDATIREALRGTARAASVDPRLQLQRAGGFAVLGEVDRAAAIVDGLLAALPGDGPWAVAAADVYVRAGRAVRARALLAGLALGDAQVDGGGHLWLWADALVRHASPPYTDLERCAVALARDRSGPPPANLVISDPGRPRTADCLGALRVAAGAG